MEQSASAGWAPPHSDATELDGCDDVAVLRRALRAKDAQLSKAEAALNDDEEMMRALSNAMEDLAWAFSKLQEENAMLKELVGKMDGLALRKSKGEGTGRSAMVAALPAFAGWDPALATAISGTAEPGRWLWAHTGEETPPEPAPIGGATPRVTMQVGTAVRLEPHIRPTTIRTDGTQVVGIVVDVLGVFYRFVAQAGMTYDVVCVSSRLDINLSVLRTIPVRQDLLRVLKMGDDDQKMHNSDSWRRRGRDSYIEWTCDTSDSYFVNVKGYGSSLGDFILTVAGRNNMAEGVPPNPMTGRPDVVEGVPPDPAPAPAAGINSDEHRLVNGDVIDAVGLPSSTSADVLARSNQTCSLINRARSSSCSTCSSGIVDSSTSCTVASSAHSGLTNDDAMLAHSRDIDIRMQQQYQWHQQQHQQQQRRCDRQSDVVLQESKLGAGQEMREYEDGRKELIFPSGQRQITHADGTKETVFRGGETQTEFTDGTEVIVKPDPDGYTQTKHPDSGSFTKFTSGQMQMTTADGTKVTVFADDDGNGRDDGTQTSKQTIEFSDGREQALWSNGDVVTTHPDGRKVRVLPSGEIQRTFPDGTIEIVTAKGLRIPAVLKPSQVECSGDYHDCDSRAVQARGGEHWTSVDQLAEYLAEPFVGNAEKTARVLFRWVAHNVKYDYKRFEREQNAKKHRRRVPRGDSQSPETVMRTGLAVCAGYSKLFCALCDVVGVHCKDIGGISGNFRKQGGEPVGHGWNAVSFDGGSSWHLCDSCWAAGSVGVPAAGGRPVTLERLGSDGGERHSGEVFTRCWDKRWWCTAPRHFVELHLPDDASDQLLERPKSRSEWERMEETQWAPTIFGLNDGDEILTPSVGILRKGQTVEFRILLNEDTPSTLRLCWNDCMDEKSETLRSQRVQGGHEHCVSVSSWRVQPKLGCTLGTVKVVKQGESTFSVLAKWKIQ